MFAPQKVDELTLEWLQHILDCELSAFDLDPDFNSSSLLCDVVRVLLGHKSSCDGPRSLIVKFPTSNANTHECGTGECCECVNSA